jgi:poly(3-hydroxybutyrate) depolymerase
LAFAAGAVPRSCIERQTWRGERDVEIRRYSLHGSGHVLASRKNSFMEYLVGGPAGDMETGPELWAFFSAHRKLPAP